LKEMLMRKNFPADRIRRGRVPLVVLAGVLAGGLFASATPAQASSPPRVGTGGVEVTGATTALVVGVADPEGQSTTIHADYALADEPWCVSEGGEGTPSETAPEDLGSGSGIESEVPVGLAGLTPASEYCVELVATNASGTAHGAQRRFTTDSAQSSGSGASGQVKPESKSEPPTLPLAPLIATSPLGQTMTAPNKPLTRAQKLRHALKACENKPKEQRASCDKQAHRKYGIAMNKTGKQASKGKK
jgi:hypothetical protein